MRRRVAVAAVCQVARVVAASPQADVEAYFEALPSVAHCDSRRRDVSARGVECVYVDPEGGILHGRDLTTEPGSGKQMLMDIMLRGVLEAMRRPGGERSRPGAGRWLSFAMVYTASGPTVESATSPVLGIGKRDVAQPGLLVPNPFFVSPAWWDDYANRTTKASAARPWANRTDRVLFRGACGPGADARLALMRLRDADQRLDVGFTKVDGYSSLAACVGDLARRVNASADDARDVLRERTKPHVAQHDFSRYRYLLHMPGSATGSYSRNLQHLFFHGAIVLIWRHAAVEWYYRYLEPGRHYLPVDETSLFRTLQRLDENPDLQHALRRGARDFADEFLAGRHLVDRWRAIFDALDRRQNTTDFFTLLDKIPEDACSCERVLGAPLCLKCEITTLKHSRLTRFVGITPPTTTRPSR